MTLEKRFTTTRESVVKVFSEPADGPVLFEASTSSEWIAQTLQEMGRVVVVADPNFAPMYAERSRKVKTDRRDAHALALALMRGTFKPVHRRDADNRRRTQELRIRDHLVKMRTASINQLKAILENNGCRIASGSTSSIHTRAKKSDVKPDWLKALVEPPTMAIENLTTQIGELDKRFAAMADNDARCRRLMTVPGVGPITSLTVAACVSDPKRFESARHFAAYTGLVPREYSSSEKQWRGRITRTGDPNVRRLLVQAAWSLVRSKSPSVGDLKAWFSMLAERRRRQRAIVALARRLGRILFAIVRDDTNFTGSKTRAALPLAA